MATTDLKLDEPGTLPRPGPVGRLVRLGFGALCLTYVFDLVQVSGDLMRADGRIQPVIWNGVLFGLFLISYIVNIGYSRALKKWPALISFFGLGGIAIIGHVAGGSVETVFLARTIWLWELYLFSHLGIAFVVAGVIATPGCEMRAFHDLYSRIMKVPTKEHYCPVGPLRPIDQWEARKSQKPN